MIIKQLIKSVPLGVKAELIGKDVYISIIFFGKNYLKLRLGQKAFLWLRNFIEEIYQESLDSYKSTQEAGQDRIDRLKHYRRDLGQVSVDKGTPTYTGISNVKSQVPIVHNGTRIQ